MNRREFIQTSLLSTTYFVLPKAIKPKQQNMLLSLPVCLAHREYHKPYVPAFNNKTKGDTK